MQQRMMTGMARSLRCQPRNAASHRMVASAAKSSIIRTIHADLKDKKRSAEEVTKQFLASIAEQEPVLNSFITVDSDRALQQVRVATERASQPLLASGSVPWFLGWAGLESNAPPLPARRLAMWTRRSLQAPPCPCWPASR
jgi:hypothetical protein